jgi:3-hydroxyacyl-[acyl-carrier-protein] dehydratase
MLHSQFERSRGGIIKFSAQAIVDGTTAVEAQLMCTMRRIEG